MDSRNSSSRKARVMKSTDRNAQTMKKIVSNNLMKESKNLGYGITYYLTFECLSVWFFILILFLTD
jgi:hypothetical protein